MILRLNRILVVVLMALGHYWMPSEAIFSKLRILPSQSSLAAAGRHQSLSAHERSGSTSIQTFNISRSHGLEALPWFRSQKLSVPVTDSPVKRISLSQANFPVPFPAKFTQKPVIRYVPQLNYDTTTQPVTTTQTVEIISESVPTTAATEETTTATTTTTTTVAPPRSTLIPSAVTDSPIRRVSFHVGAGTTNGVTQNESVKAPSYSAGSTQANKKVTLSESPIHYIKLPPRPYDFVPGLGYISRPLSPVGFAQDFMKNSAAPQLPYLPIDVVINGKFNGLYVINKTTTAKPTEAPALTTEASDVTFTAESTTLTTTSLPVSSTTSKPHAKPTDSRIIRLKGPYFFNGKPGNVFTSHSPYKPNYFEELQKLYSKLKI